MTLIKRFGKSCKMTDKTQDAWLACILPELMNMNVSYQLNCLYYKPYR